MARAAVDGGGMFRVRVTFDVGMAASARQTPVNAGFLRCCVDINAMARLVFEVLLAMAGQTFGVLLRRNGGNAECENKHGR
jgi:hypothetical protein